MSRSMKPNLLNHYGTAVLKMREDDSFYHVSLVNNIEDPELEQLSSQMCTLSSGSGLSQQVHVIDGSGDYIGVHPIVNEAGEGDQTADDNITGLNANWIRKEDVDCGVLSGNGGDGGLGVLEGGGRGPVLPDRGRERRSAPSRGALGLAPSGLNS